ncbi:glycosyltransferase family 2 protein [Bacteroidota bacterium]
MKIAILLTCFNRKEFTLKCLNNLYLAYNESVNKFQMDVYLTDDGSTDGTSLAVLKAYPNINVLSGTGNLYWAGGMRNSWREAKKIQYDCYFLLNDDTFIKESLFNEMFLGYTFCNDTFGENGILVGSTKDNESLERTYGGSTVINKFKGTFNKITPNNTYQSCELGNANIMFVHSDVVSKIGILSDQYCHGVADYDYTLRAVENKIPVLIMPNYVGECKGADVDKNEVLLNKKSIKDRYVYLNSPIGLAFSDTLKYQKRFYPKRYILVFLTGYFKVFFPRLYVFFNNKLR